MPPSGLPEGGFFVWNGNVKFIIMMYFFYFCAKYIALKFGYHLRKHTCIKSHINPPLICYNYYNTNK